MKKSKKKLKKLRHKLGQLDYLVGDLYQESAQWNYYRDALNWMVARKAEHDQLERLQRHQVALAKEKRRREEDRQHQAALIEEERAEREERMQKYREEVTDRLTEEPGAWLARNVSWD